MRRQFTATIYLFEGSKTLLIQHGKLNKWLPPGGHVEENELPSEAAIREAREETGLEVELLQQENLWVERWNARSVPRPYLCLLEEIPAHGKEEAHQHIDQIFLGRVLGGELSHEEGKQEKLRWFSLEELQALEPDREIFMETLETLEHLFERDLSQLTVGGIR